MELKNKKFIYFITVIISVTLLILTCYAGVIYPYKDYTIERTNYNEKYYEDFKSSELYKILFNDRYILIINENERLFVDFRDKNVRAINPGFIHSVIGLKVFDLTALGISLKDKVKITGGDFDFIDVKTVRINYHMNEYLLKIN